MASKRRLNRTRRREERRAYLREIRRCRCGKVRGTDLRDAQEKRGLARARDGGHNSVRYYQCCYGGWHWTSRLKAALPARPKDPEGLSPE